MPACEILSLAPATSRWIASATAVRPIREAISDRARGTLLGLSVGNLLGLPVEGDRYDWIADSYPGGLTEIDPREAGLPMDDDLAQAIDLGDALLAGGDYPQRFREPVGSLGTRKWARHRHHHPRSDPRDFNREADPRTGPHRLRAQEPHRPQWRRHALRPGGYRTSRQPGPAGRRFRLDLRRHPLRRYVPVVLHSGERGDRRFDQRGVSRPSRSTGGRALRRLPRSGLPSHRRRHPR